MILFMFRIFAIFPLIIFSITSAGYCQDDRQITRNNEFHGVTLERIFDHSWPKKNIHKIRYYYDQSGNLILHEVFLSEFMAANKGFYKMKVFFNLDQIKVKKELYHLEYLNEQKGFFKKVILYNLKGQIVKEDILDRYGTKITL